LLAYPGLNLVYASFVLDESSDERSVEVAFREVDRVARQAGGNYVCEVAPSWAKADRDMFGALESAGSIVASLKQRFDPKGVLNPGRFAGRL
jgi:FAD/FMN-containing dehydrogenase